MKPSFSIIHPFYNNPKADFPHNTEGLTRHLDNWFGIDQSIRRRMEIIIVDDHSPEPINVDMLKNKGFDISVYRILDDINWNVTGARNLGITKAKYDWLFLSDFDFSVTNLTLSGFPEIYKGDNYTYWPELYYPSMRRKRWRCPHPNTFFIKKDVIKKAGMYDEDFAGHWGYEDSFLHEVTLPLANIEKFHPHEQFDSFSVRWYDKLSTGINRGDDNTNPNPMKYQIKKDQVAAGTYVPGAYLRFKYERLL